MWGTADIRSTAELYQHYREVRARLRTPRPLPPPPVPPAPPIIARRPPADPFANLTHAVRHIGKVQTIIELVARRFGVTRAEIKGPSRTQRLIKPRFLAIHLTRQMTTMCLLQIGRQFGGRDHTSIRHAIIKTARWIEADAELRAMADEIMAEIRRAA